MGMAARPEGLLSKRAQWVLQHPLEFGLRSWRQFRLNGGLLLASAVAYHTLLSLIPILALVVIGLSHWFDPALVETAIRQFMQLVAPTQIDPVLQQLQYFRARSGVIGLVGFTTLIFFSATAFATLGRALAVIFRVDDGARSRKPWISLLLPYGFVLFVGLAVLAVSLLLAALDLAKATWLSAWLPSAGVMSTLAGFAGEVVLFALVYRVLTPVKVRLRHALVGATTAALLWEVMRYVLVWYFSNLSTVNLIYGAFATALVIVLSLEVAVTILLFGAQVIREYGLLDLR